jgi:hypothetical protein
MPIAVRNQSCPAAGFAAMENTRRTKNELADLNLKSTLTSRIHAYDKNNIRGLNGSTAD